MKPPVVALSAPTSHSRDTRSRPRAAVVGTGLLTPLGATVEQTYCALLAGEAIQTHARVALALPSGRPRVTSLAIAAARQAIAAARWSPADLLDDRTALVVATSKGPVDAWLSTSAVPSDAEAHRGPHERSPDGRAPAEVALHEPFDRCAARGGSTSVDGSWGLAEIAAAIACDLRLGFGPRLTVSAACASGLHAIIRACMLIEEASASRVIVVAAESSLHPMFLASFRRLGVVCPQGSPCRPFDRNRRGFLLSEAAAAMCLEAIVPSQESPILDRPTTDGLRAAAHAASSTDELQARDVDRISTRPGAGAMTVIDGYALGGDATHLTGGDPNGATLGRLLARVIDGRAVDLIQAHGTGTVANDPIELAALDASVSRDHAPASLYSHKAALGHSLGAAALVSLVLNCQAHALGIVPPNLHTTVPMPVGHLVISRGSVRRRIRRSLALAAGFGGPVAVVGLRSVEG